MLPKKKNLEEERAKHTVDSLYKDYVDDLFSEVLTGEITDELPYKIKITVEDEIIAAEEQAEVSQKVDEILSILTERQREIIYLRYMQECSYEEIAEIMQISVPACRKLLYRTLLKLKHNNTLVLFYLLLSINVG